MTAQVKAFMENPLFMPAITSWFFAQILKAVIVLLRGRGRHWREIVAVIAWRTGGMPSSHAALMSALTASVGLCDGVDSNLFVVTCFMALVVMRDAMGVRRSSGIQARTLNSLGQLLKEQFKVDYHLVKEIQGHTPLEVVVGALLGIFIAAAYAFL